jgi:hypothetical protein
VSLLSLRILDSSGRGSGGGCGGSSGGGGGDAQVR